MKKLILLILTFSITTAALAQLEYYSDPAIMNAHYEALLKQVHKKIPQYQNHLRTADPAWFEEYMISFQEDKLFPGVSACFLRDGQMFWKSHNGFADIVGAIPVSDQTAYTVASISKTIMITAVMQLYEQGFFELEDDISDHIPFLVRNNNHPDEVITIKQLMTHNSSIQDNYVVLNDALYAGGDNPIPMSSFLEGYLIEGGEYYQLDNYYSYSPGYTYNYSNVGSCILAYMVEHKTGLDFETYCQENVFGPLGMEETSYLFDNLNPDNLAIPYTIQGNTVIPTPQSSWPIYPIGNLKVSSMQLAKHLGMYINQGTYNDSVLLDQSTVELITDHHYINNSYNLYMGLIWFIDPYPWFYQHTGRWYGFNTIYGFNKENNSGMIWLSNGDNYELIIETLDFWTELIIYSGQYEPFSIESLTMNDTDGDGILEAGETIEFYPGVRNNTNILNTADNLSVIVSSSSSMIDSFTDSTINIGDIEYLEIIQNLSDPVSFQISDPIPPGNIELNITYSWGEEMYYETTHEVYIGHAEILLVSDEEDNRGKIIPTANWYREVLDSLGYNYQLYDLGQRGDPTSSFLNKFPVAIWFSGYDSLNTLTPENQILLSGYLDNGGKLFLSGQKISDELAGSDFLENYLYVDHVEDTWSGVNTIFGVEDDPIGNELAFMVSSGDGLDNQYSMSVVEPMVGAHKVFTYQTGPDGAAIRYENETYKSVFFGFGFEAIYNYENRHEVLFRILNDYFGLIVGTEEKENSKVSRNNLQVFPNPITSSTTLSYLLSEKSKVKLDIYSINGKHTSLLINEVQKKGQHDVVIDMENIPAGIYICILRTNKGIQTIKMIKL